MPQAHKKYCTQWSVAFSNVDTHTKGTLLVFFLISTIRINYMLPKQLHVQSCESLFDLRSRDSPLKFNSTFLHSVSALAPWCAGTDSMCLSFSLWIGLLGNFRNMHAIYTIRGYVCTSSINLIVIIAAVWWKHCVYFY